jgi:hypothetical protein
MMNKYTYGEFTRGKSSKFIRENKLLYLAIGFVGVGLVAALIILIVLLSAPTSSKPQLKAIDYVNAFVAQGFPVDNIIDYNEETDENGLLGRPNQYTSKVNFADTRLEQYDIEDPVGGTVEVFTTKKDMERRKKYIESIQDAAQILVNAYIYVSDDGLALLRISFELTPAEAQKYADIFQSEDILEYTASSVMSASEKQEALESGQTVAAYSSAQSTPALEQSELSENTTPEESSAAISTKPSADASSTTKPSTSPSAAPSQSTSQAPAQTEKPSSDGELASIREYADSEWPDDSGMADWEYDQQVKAYKYCKGLPSSDIKDYAVDEWTKGGYIIWTMVKWEYDQQTEALSDFNNVPSSDIKEYAQKEWTKSGFTVWTMALWEYEQQYDAYENMNGIDWDGKSAAISKWTEGKYIVWTMVQWEYENR